MNVPGIAKPVLQVGHLSKTFTSKRGFPNPVTVTVRAVDDVSFTVNAGEAFGLVGESGCGKSTTGRALLRLIEPDAGTVTYRGQDVRAAEGAALRAIRRKLQMVFQDPYSSLNPRRSIGKTLAEPMLVHRIGERRQIAERVKSLLAEVGLPATAAERYPHEFSGGQRQRIGIARALSVDPELIVADEPVSALDVSIQAQVLLLLRDLQARRGLSYVFVAHDLGVVRFFCQSVAVMYLGRIVESGPVEQVFNEPLHPYTKVLREASPVPDPRARSIAVRIEGEVPSAANPPTGCHFHPRCPHAMPVCKTEYPKWTQASAARGVACHLHNAPAR
jgi:peptide/nickel transport system ATP-binding protein